MNTTADSPMRPPRTHVGCTIYYFGVAEQNRLLVECIGPLVEELRGQGLCQGFVFCRFDARGPHILALFTCVQATRSRLESLISAAVASYLDTSPSTVQLDARELAERHRACVGRPLSAVDTLPGLADNNTFVVHEHSDEHYPFVMGHGWHRSELLWPVVDKLSMWAITCLAETDGSPSAQAIRWLASFESALESSGHRSADYWLYHASTLARGLEERLANNAFHPADALVRMGESNRKNLARLWTPGTYADDLEPARLIEIVMVEQQLPRERRYLIVRQVLHGMLLQLGIPVSVQLVIILFAWLRANGHVASSPANVAIGSSTEGER